MKAYFIFILFWMAGFTSQALCQPLTDEEIKVNAIERLDSVTSWFVQDGIFEYFENSEDAEWIRQKVRKDWVVSSYTGPVVEGNNFYAKYIIKSAGIYYDIILLHGEQYNNSLYEYWVVKISGQKWAHIDPHCSFIVTKASDSKAKRNLLKQEPQFFQSYQINDDEQFRLPIEDLALRYRLSPWTYSQCYDNPDLTNYYVYFDRESERYVQEKYTWFKRLLWSND